MCSKRGTLIRRRDSLFCRVTCSCNFNGVNMKRYRDTRYYACEDGHIHNGDTGRQLVEMLDSQGYMYVNLYDPVKHTIRVHKIVCEAYHGASQLVVNHKNGVKSDNTPLNLEWVTNSYNTQHAYDTGLKSKGSELSWAVLDEISVTAIKTRMLEGMRDCDIMRALGIPLSKANLLSQIRSGRAWSHVMPGIVMPRLCRGSNKRI